MSTEFDAHPLATPGAPAGASMARFAVPVTVAALGSPLLDVLPSWQHHIDAARTQTEAAITQLIASFSRALSQVKNSGAQPIHARRNKHQRNQHAVGHRSGAQAAQYYRHCNGGKEQEH